MLDGYRANGYWAAGIAACALTIGASAAVIKPGTTRANRPAERVDAMPKLARGATVQAWLGMSPGWPLAAGTAAAPPVLVATPAPVPAPASAPAPAPQPIAKGAAGQIATPVSRVATARTLPPLDLTTMRLWNWNGTWIGSEWTNANSPIAWKFDRIRQAGGADTVLTLDAAGAPQLQGGGATAARSDGLWETEVTLPQLRDGLVVAPLWLYDPASRDEIDFELAGRRGLDVTMHVYVNGVHRKDSVRLFAGTDLSGQRKRFGIRVDQAAGVVEMFVDGKLAHRWDRARLGFFVSKPLKPWIEMWAAKPTDTGFVQWLGAWRPLAPGQALTMRVHGYGYTTLGGQIVR